MKHDDIWRALDTLAAEYGLSSSGLAKRAGLDATTFNPSKRRMPDGRPRWPGTESLAKVLDATGALIYRRAIELGVGRKLDTDWFTSSAPS